MVLLAELDELEYTYKTATNSQTNESVIPAKANHRIVLYQINMTSAGDIVLNFKDGSGGAVLHTVRILANTMKSYFTRVQTSVGTALVFDSTVTGQQFFNLLYKYKKEQTL